MDTQTQIERLIELAVIQRSELKQLVEQLPQLREHLNAEVERTIEEVEPQLRAELEEFCDKRAVDANAKVGSALEAKIVELSKALELTTQARFNAIKDQERKVEELRNLAAKQIEGHVAALPEAVKEIVGAELARFPRAGEIDQLRKEFAEPKGLNPRGKWLPSETYNRLDLVTYNGDSFTSAIDGNRSRPSRNAAEWTLIAARGTGGGGPSSLSELTSVPSNGDLLIGSGTSWVTSNLTAGAGISITVGAGEITISATDGDITLDDGTAASPSLHFTNDADTGIYRPAANTLGISVSGTQVAYFDENGLTVPSAGVVAGGSFHGANGNANNPSLSFSGDQDTGFFRHQSNQIGIALGGTQYATLTSTTFSITPSITVAGILTVNSTTDSTSKDTGAIITEGGLGVEKSATFGGNLTVSGGTVTSGVGNTLLLQQANYGHGLISNAAGETKISALNGQSIRLQTQGADALTINSSQNATLAGNLTVSGTGGISIGSATFTGGRALTATTGSGNNVSLRLLQSSVADWEIQNVATTGTLAFVSSGTTAATLTGGGNLLLGNTVNATGLLQLGTTSSTTSAGGIGFGTDTALYRISAGTLALDHLAGTGPNLEWRESGTAKLRIQTVSGDAYISTASAASLYLRTNSTTALTLDSSQVATFASNVKLGSSKILYFDGGINTYLQGSSGALYIGTNGGAALTLDSSQRCILAGALRLNNAYTAGAPTATGYVTLQDSAGNTYKVLVGT